MKIKTLSTVLSFIFISTASPQQGFVHQQSEGYVVPTDEKVLQKLDRWQDLKFGVLFHWGLYSVPGIVESWSICSEDVDWIPRDSTMTYSDYKKWYWDLKDQFNPTDFDPDQWATVMEKAGMKYAIFTTKHHDGFNMFDTGETDFSIANGPFKNHPKADVAKFVFEAFRKKNFMIGAYFSKPDWHNQNYWWNYYATPNRSVNYKIERHPQRWENFKKFTYNQLNEITSNYGSMDILWLDGGWVAPPRQDIDMDRIAGMVRRNQPGILIVDRTVKGKHENYQTPERSIPDEQLPFPWESCIPLSNDWGWVPNAPYKSARKVINTLIEITAKGGCLLLGVGPTAKGLIEQPVAERLEKVGEWLEVNGEGIYNTRTTPGYKSGNTWFTAGKDKKRLYAIYALPENEQLPPTIEWEGNPPAKGARMILLQNNKPVKWKSGSNKTTVYLPKNLEQEPLVLSFNIN